MDDSDKLKKDIEAVVATIFSEKEEANIRKKTEEALKKSAVAIEELTVDLESKNTELEELAGKLEDAEEQNQKLNTELEAAQKETEEVASKLSDVEKEVEKMKKDKAAETRMGELRDSGVAHSNEEHQEAKIREMDDEAFSAYKSELVSLRNAVLSEIKADKTTAEKEAAEKEAAEKEAAVKEAAEKEAAEKKAAEDKEDLGTPPAKIDPGKAIAAAMNMEFAPSADMVDKYAKLGKAMAESMKKKN